jgi:hypothetical protein
MMVISRIKYFFGTGILQINIENNFLKIGTRRAGVPIYDMGLTW